jgi:RHS repeat-associated protein
VGIERFFELSSASLSCSGGRGWITEGREGNEEEQRWPQKGTYDPANKLGSATSGNTTTSYLYNDQGVGVRSWTSGSNPTLYLTDANNPTGYAQTLEELEALGGAPDVSYTLGDDVLSQTTGTTLSLLKTQYLLADGHGSTRQVASGALVTSHYNYDAYGLTQTATSSASAETSHLYCREQYDSVLQMYNLRARYYNPSNGRFNQRDSFEGYSDDPQSLHKYTYCRGDPVNGLDPSGRFDLGQLLMVTGIILILASVVLSGGIYKTLKHKAWPVQEISADDVSTFHKDCALLCNDVYKNEGATTIGQGGWHKVAPSQVGIDPADFNSGSFFARLYANQSGAYVLAFRGTELEDPGDDCTDITQALVGTLCPSEYDDALYLARRVREAVGGAELTMTGHSLGGGMAAAAATYTQSDGVTFNAAGLNPITELVAGGLSYSKSVVNYSVEGEALTGGQNQTWAPEAFGRLYTIPPAAQDADASAFTKHKMEVVLRALKL